MRLSITRKLFLAILAANLLVAIAVAVAMRTSFNAGFIDYVSEREAQRLRDLSMVLASAYRENGSWSFLQGNEALWRQLNAPSFTGPRAPPMQRPDEEPGRSFGDGRPRREGRGPPPSGPFPFEGPPPRGERRGPTTGLLNEARQPVVGTTLVGAESVLQPIIVDGKTVGWLNGSFIAAPLRDIDRRFQEKQLAAAWAIGAIALVLSGAVALPLARGFLRPVKEIASATHSLAAGDYTTRVRAFGRDELGQLSADFNRLAAALQRTEQMRRDFTADISHELRTPLAVLRGELEALQDGVRKLTPESLASLQAEVATLSKLIDDLYDLSLADAGALAYRMEPLPIVDTLERALGAFGERFTARRIALETQFGEPESLIISGDPMRMMQLFNNLLENSIRYTDPDGRLRITAHREYAKVNLAFEDSAPGVPEGSLPRLFERLYRVENSRSRDMGGAGLGLALCRNIVEAHGGTIEARASQLGGVCIDIALPLLRP